MKKHGPWKIKKSETKYQNPWIKVVEDQVIRPDGSEGIFGIVNALPGVSVMPVDDKRQVYLTEEFHYAIGRNSIEVVSGGIDENEKPLDAAKRELREELGIEANEWINLGLVDPLTTVVRAPVTLFLARNLNFRDAKPERTELIETVKVPLKKAVQMVVDSEITHGPSCVLILKADSYLE